MFKRIAIASAVVALTAATPAFAQDAGAFNGFYIGALGGWDHVSVDGESDDGFLYGLNAGYDFNTSGVVAGIELEATDSSMKECVTDAGIEDCLFAKRDLSVGVRVGAEVAPGTLLYAKVGYTNARFKATEDDGVTFVEGTMNIDGVRGGVGLEHQFSGNFFLKGEYRYSNYELGVERHQVVGGVGFRFGGN
jgi:outer membrane immunogenic protein